MLERALERLGPRAPATGDHKRLAQDFIDAPEVARLHEGASELRQGLEPRRVLVRQQRGCARQQVYRGGHVPPGEGAMSGAAEQLAGPLRDSARGLPRRAATHVRSLRAAPATPPP